MTKTQLALRALDIPSIHRVSVGFDNMLDELSKAQIQHTNVNYPPYNLLKHDDDHFSIELAVAGFSEGDINITVEKNVLTITGGQVQGPNEAAEQTVYLHRGISARNFTRSFTLADHVEVTGARVESGILTVQLERHIPLEQQPKVIAIEYK